MDGSTTMTVYADTTAVVERVADGWRADLLEEVWAAAGRVVAAATLYPEVRSCVRVRQVDGVLDEAGAAAAIERLDELVADVELVAVDATLAGRAAELAERHGLDSDAALHLAAALAVDAPRVVVATFDPGLAQAAVEAGLAVIPQARVAVAA
ncbi:MAG: type II toxin-antitoxin system VapC family toxin [Solirubrobacterales bacterium]|nr:type II toxin-antitoxin system VapC family toxin [Solirubrobacterales bacterium]